MFHYYRIPLKPGAYLLFQVRTRSPEGTLRGKSEQWYPGQKNDGTSGKAEELGSFISPHFLRFPDPLQLGHEPDVIVRRTKSPTSQVRTFFSFSQNSTRLSL